MHASRYRGLILRSEPRVASLALDRQSVLPALFEFPARPRRTTTGALALQKARPPRTSRRGKRGLALDARRAKKGSAHANDVTLHTC